ncbi:DNA cytosine methyltransferase [Chryseobacterium sp. KACC 21268]|nr:DNA cytosine methyltransferase [Chryseobacterium sp. KACC 21268]
MSKEITLIDLFSGIGGFALGLKNAGFKIVKHYFSEIDHHSIANYKKNFPNAEYIGNIKFIQSRDFGRNVAIAFGSPCQDFSMAGKRRGLGGERSSLIEYALSTIIDVQPDFFIWENVKGAYSSNDRADFWAIIKAFADLDNYRFEKQLVNTAWLLPQNRERIYLAGHLAGRSRPGIFPIGQNDFISDFQKGSEKGQSQTQHLAKTLTSGTAPGMKATDNFISAPKIAGTLTAGGNSGGLHSDMTLIDMNGRNVNVADNCITGTIDANYSKGTETSYGARPFIQVGAIRGRNPDNPKSRESGLPTEQMLEINKEGISNTLTSVQKDNVVITQIPGGNNKGADFKISPTISANGFEHNNHLQIGTWRTHKDGQGFRKVSDDNCPTIPARAREDGSGQPVISIQNSIRRLTEIECERLQGFPDDWTKYGMYLSKKVHNYIFGKKKKWRTVKAENALFVHAINHTKLIEKKIPATARYKQCGNAVTAKMAETIGRRIELF